jgi:hypothetical protein
MCVEVANCLDHLISACNGAAKVVLMDHRAFGSVVRVSFASRTVSVL